MRYALKPAEKGKVRLFAHSGEAVVFWLALAGLVFLAIVSLYRGFYLQKVVDRYNGVAGDVNPLMLQMKRVIAINDSLEVQLEATRRELNATNAKLDSLEQRVRRAPAPATTPPTTVTPPSRPNRVVLPPPD